MRASGNSSRKNGRNRRFSGVFSAQRRFPFRRGLVLVKCSMRTGRRHQIRRHLANFGCPLLGDVAYGFRWSMAARSVPKSLININEDVDELETLFPAGRFALHASALRLDGAASWEAPLPDDMARVVAFLEAEERRLLGSLGSAPFVALDDVTAAAQ